MKTPSERGVSAVTFKQKKFIAKFLADEIILYDDQTNAAHCLNGLAADLWNACAQERTVAAIQKCLSARWSHVNQAALQASLGQMKQAGLLDAAGDSEFSSPDEPASAGRRALIRNLGLTATAALPLAITSVLVPPPAAAASCVGIGGSCATRPCCPGLRCNNGSHCANGP
jgi:hypothetical protein